MSGNPLCRGGQSRDKRPRQTRACPATAARPCGPLADGPRDSVGQWTPASFPFPWPSLAPRPARSRSPPGPQLRVTSAALPATATNARERPARRLRCTHCACATRCIMGPVVFSHCQLPALSLSLKRPEK